MLQEVEPLIELDNVSCKEAESINESFCFACRSP